MAIRAENIPAEPVNPIIIQACSWCKKDEMHIPLQDCMMCSHNQDDGETVWCSWEPAEKPCEECGIPAGLCEPETCELLRVIKKAAC
jgi:hypothetical protein